MSSPKLLSAAFLTLFFVLLSFSTIAAQTATVATWHIGRTEMSEDRVVRVAEAIGRMDPDIIVLQGLGNESVAMAIKNRLAGYSVEILRQTSSWHIAIFYRRGVTVADASLIEGSDGGRRSIPKALAASVKIGDLEFLLIGVHMTFTQTSWDRLRQVTAVANFIKRRTSAAELKVMVVGAFSKPQNGGSNELAALSPGYSSNEFLRYLSDSLKRKVSFISQCSEGGAKGSLADVFAISKNLSETYVRQSLQIVHYRHQAFELASGPATCTEYRNSFAHHLPLIAKFRVGPNDDASNTRRPLNPRNVILPAIVIPPPPPQPAAETRLESLADFDKLSRGKQISELNRHGPFLPGEINLSDFSMRAFLKSSWKLVVSYSLRANASAVVRIDRDGVEPLVKALGTGDDQRVIIEIPDRFGTEPEPGRISIKTSGAEGSNAFELDYIAASPEGADEASMTRGPLEVNHHGRHAEQIVDVTPFQRRLRVVSFDVKIDSIKTSEGQKIVYGFTLAKEYDGARATFALITTDSQNAVVSVPVFSEPFGRTREIHDREWNGQDENGRFSYGQHRLIVTAWYGYETSGLWFGPKIGPRVRVGQ